MRIRIINGHVVDPSQGLDEIADILIDGGKVAGVTLKGGKRNPGEKRKGTAPAGILKDDIDGLVIDASGLYVLPGLVDMHTHLREPGYEYKETIRTGTMAAVRGGFTTVCAMPNTYPVNDNSSVTEFIIRRAIQEGACTVYPIGAITKGQNGTELAEIGAMRSEGCVAFTDDGKPVMDSLLMRRAMEYSRAFDVPIISHCEDMNLSEGGVMNEGRLSVILGLRGIPSASEEIMVARDIALAGLTRGRLHIAHVSTAGSVRLIREAKGRGLPVTAETCPHYFSITEEAVEGYNTNAKVNPPLRTASDVAAVKEGLSDGTLDAIATDHAPHHRDEKMKEFDQAPSGISGLETALGLSLRLVSEGDLTMSRLVEKMALNPSRILGLKKGNLKTGSDGDVTIIDPEREYSVDPSSFVSKGKNSPFCGWKLKGKAVMTVCKGKVNEE